MSVRAAQLGFQPLDGPFGLVADGLGVAALTDAELETLLLALFDNRFLVIGTGGPTDAARKGDQRRFVHILSTNSSFYINIKRDHKAPGLLLSNCGLVPSVLFLYTQLV